MIFKCRGTYSNWGEHRLSSLELSKLREMCKERGLGVAELAQRATCVRELLAWKQEQGGGDEDEESDGGGEGEEEGEEEEEESSDEDEKESLTVRRERLNAAAEAGQPLADDAAEWRSTSPG